LKLLLKSALVRAEVVRECAAAYVVARGGVGLILLSDGAYARRWRVSQTGACVRKCRGAAALKAKPASVEIAQHRHRKEK